MNKKELLNKLNEKFANCLKCPLSQNRNKIIFGSGNYDAKIMFIGEAPGAKEDLEGEPFVGKSGKFLREQMLRHSIDINQIFITNIVKCRPPKNRLPSAKESNICTALLLLPQIDIIKPEIIVTVGKHSEQQLKRILSCEKESIFKIIHLPHPAYIIRNPKLLQKLQEILKKIASEANKT
jgi:uracil-DNA glycosylase family 4